jgi:hypothetical protein
MRAIILLAPLLLFACSGSTPPPPPERAADANAADQAAAAQTEQCLDNPELAKTWGDCNVKSTVYLASEQLGKCRVASPKAKGTVSFQLRIKPDGTVKSARALGGKHGKHTSCVARVFRKLKFAPPPQGKEAPITVPYQLEP